MATKLKRPRDPFQLAKLIGDISTGQVVEVPETKKTKATRASGAKGGASRAKSLTPEQRSDIARIAAQARWKKRAS
jgi:hypothetical protein